MVVTSCRNSVTRSASLDMLFRRLFTATGSYEQDKMVMDGYVKVNKKKQKCLIYDFVLFNQVFNMLQYKPVLAYEAIF